LSSVWSASHDNLNALQPVVQVANNTNKAIQKKINKKIKPNKKVKNKAKQSKIYCSSHQLIKQKMQNKAEQSRSAKKQNKTSRSKIKQSKTKQKKMQCNAKQIKENHCFAVLIDWRTSLICLGKRCYASASLPILAYCQRLQFGNFTLL
jgi:hypothetical protein